MIQNQSTEMLRLLIVHMKQIIGLPILKSFYKRILSLTPFNFLLIDGDRVQTFTIIQKIRQKLKVSQVFGRIFELLL